MKEKYINKIFANCLIETKDFGNIYTPTIKEIFNFGENEYYFILNILMGSVGDLENNENLPDDFVYFDYIMFNSLKNKEMEKMFSKFFNLILKDDVRLYPPLECFVIGEIENKNTTDVKTIDRNNFDEIQKIISIQNMIEINKKPRKKKNKKKTRKDYILEKRDKGRENLTKAKGETFSLTNFVLNLVMVFKDIDKVLNLNIVQANKIFEKFIKKENYFNEYQQYLAGAELDKLSIRNNHWSSNK